MSSLQQLRICTEKFSSHDAKTMKDIREGDHSPEHMKHLQAAFLVAKLWKAGDKIRIGFVYPNGKKDVQVPRTDIRQMETSGRPIDPIQYKITPDMKQEDIVKMIVNERIIPLVGLDIAFVEDSSQANVRISFQEDKGSWSLVGIDALGTKNPEPTMNFGWIQSSCVVHEMGHMLGMAHEHQNTIGGGGIQWNEPVVYKWAAETQGWDKETTKHNILDKYDVTQLNGSSFDPLSIMLYFFPPELTTNGQGTKQNLRLSGEDVLWINKNYAKGAPQTAEQFYQKVYNMSLQKAIEMSNIVDTKIKEGKNPNSINVDDILKGVKSPFTLKKVLKVAAGILILVVLILLVKRLLERPKPPRKMFRFVNKFSP